MKELYFDYVLRTRYAETDQMGVVYYGNYPQYLELGRVEWLRSIGFTYKAMEEEGIMMPVVSLQIQYKKPALYDELITIRTKLKELPSTKIEFDYEILNEKGELLSTANTVLVFVDARTFRPVRCPEKVLKLIKAKSEE
ncbi:GTP cyclohydrolase I (GTP-CH-I) [Capnocytophaga ochracea]|jgi:acyl-coA thioester hydrolase, ybgC/ybaW family|uniref:GTP cyclohydrolase I (GTP-CH-I) n=1 Tax=Capnocytophaga ochracea TaxID=1018 RepID=A0A7Z8YGD0_CAPOC|nr:MULTISPECIES: thioesterase family protein [Capnocytophaga]EIW92749.1 putative tol-pal system-associated acyl-CoA thioesterase [Capnocytophaga sp. oral taxon 412 str. F0487]EJF36522.1 putative tol-pal system-associated acyl-CoA thioesterase [Capnocytophaga sp. oral taxon 335 str. F0486]EKY08288.1 putative tol-pal system-associated acyl-CoA thioesterase [Capnocytophaga sp. oral taxon 380 str. F0488]EPD98896.1 tol-pal system-associated acyl-CoA thioesterase [Capnocytophaga sp. oral taxon 336 st